MGIRRSQRTHRATGRMTPAEAYRATAKAQAAGTRAAGRFRLRYDLTDRAGRITLRRASRCRRWSGGGSTSLRDKRGVASQSIGEEPNRRVVVLPRNV